MSLSQEECLVNRRWYVFLLTSLVTFFGGLAIIGTVRFTTNVVRKWRNAELEETADQSVDGTSKNEKRSCLNAVTTVYTRIQFYAEACVSGKKLIGRIMGSKFVAATDKLSFWLKINSCVDYFTIPPQFVAILLGRDWLGLRFLRAIRLMSLPDILQYLNIISSSKAIRLAQLVCISIALWIASAGLNFLLEVSGDPFLDFENRQNITMSDSLYFTLVTLTTVGYGDVTCKTVLGRWYNAIFLVCGIALFATYIPELSRLLGQSNSSLSKAYRKRRGLSHVVVCGCVNFTLTHSFIEDFLHKERQRRDIKCVFLDTNKPDSEFAALLKRHESHTAFMYGNAMNAEDLKLVALSSAKACLVMANNTTNNPDLEDSLNTMRVVSVKTLCPQVRVIVQLLKGKNKAFLEGLPYWQRTDQIICLPDLMQGFIASSLLAPGVSTLYGNLMVLRSYKPDSSVAPWQQLYMNGANSEVYTTYFSPAFHGLTFTEAVRICYMSLKVVLFGLERVTASDSAGSLLLNPGNDHVITPEHKGFLICRSEAEARRVSLFCPVCHDNDDKIQLIKGPLCNCLTDNSTVHLFVIDGEGDNTNTYLSRIGSKENLDRGLVIDSVAVHMAELLRARPDTRSCRPVFAYSSDEEVRKSQSAVSLACFVGDSDHEPLLNNFESCILQLVDHIIFCVFCNSTSSALRLRNFIAPLRSAHMLRDRLKPIVIIAHDKLFLFQAWKLLSPYQPLFFALDSPLSASVLDYVHVDTCSSCVIVNLCEETLDSDPCIVDKDPVMCSLTVKAAVAQRRRVEGHEENMRFLSGDIIETNEVDPFLTEPYTSGHVFAVSLLHTVMSTVFFNPDALSIIHMQSQSATGDEGEETCHSVTSDNVSQVRTYGELFTSALDKHGGVCLGLYRRRHADLVTSSRIVITNPPFSLPLQHTDQVYVFCRPGVPSSVFHHHGDNVASDCQL